MAAYAQICGCTWRGRGGARRLLAPRRGRWKEGRGGCRDWPKTRAWGGSEGLVNGIASPDTCAGEGDSNATGTVRGVPRLVARISLALGGALSGSQVCGTTQGDKVSAGEGDHPPYDLAGKEFRLIPMPNT